MFVLFMPISINVRDDQFTSLKKGEGGGEGEVRNDEFCYFLFYFVLFVAISFFTTVNCDALSKAVIILQVVGYDC